MAGNSISNASRHQEEPLRIPFKSIRFGWSGSIKTRTIRKSVRLSLLRLVAHLVAHLVARARAQRELRRRPVGLPQIVRRVRSKSIGQA